MIESGKADRLTLNEYESHDQFVEQAGIRYGEIAKHDLRLVISNISAWASRNSITRMICRYYQLNSSSRIIRITGFVVDSHREGVCYYWFILQKRLELV